MVSPPRKALLAILINECGAYLGGKVDQEGPARNIDN
jgi:hypothetical protein